MDRINIPESIQKIWGWLSFADYEAAKEQGTNDIIARFGRGNVNFQNGSVIDESSLLSLSEAGDRAIARLNNLKTVK